MVIFRARFKVRFPPVRSLRSGVRWWKRPFGYVEGRSFGDVGRISLRIGINSGPAVAGVIGRTKFIYDLWGDTVNVASRMECHGTSGKLQITASTYELIKNDFICEPKGSIIVKGKGVMPIWHVLAEKKSYSLGLQSAEEK